MDLSTTMIFLMSVIVSVSNVLLVVYLTRAEKTQRMGFVQTNRELPLNKSKIKRKPLAKTDEELHYSEIEENRNKKY